MKAAGKARFPAPLNIPSLWLNEHVHNEKLAIRLTICGTVSALQLPSESSVIVLLRVEKADSNLHPLNVLTLDKTLHEEIKSTRPYLCILDWKHH